MPGSNKVLVDTSVWIGYFRKKEPCFSIVAQLLAEERVCSAGIVVAELMQGAKSEKELGVLRDFTHVFEFLPEGPKVWREAGELSFRLRRKGKTIGLSDCYIAVLARSGQAEILSLDSHFGQMKSEARIQVYRLEE